MRRFPSRIYLESLNKPVLNLMLAIYPNIPQSCIQVFVSLIDIGSELTISFVRSFRTGVEDVCLVAVGERCGLGLRDFYEVELSCHGGKGEEVLIKAYQVAPRHL